MKQTAVDWFFNELQRMQYFIGNDMVEAYNQAKKMEKQQIIDAYNEGGCNWDSELEAEQYYSETFREIEKL
jgi:hypothetical protein